MRQLDVTGALCMLHCPVCLIFASGVPPHVLVHLQHNPPAAINLSALHLRAAPSPVDHHPSSHPRCAVQAPSGAPPHPSRWCAAWMSFQAPPWSSQTCCSSRQPSQVRRVYVNTCQRRTLAEAPHPALPAQRLSCCAPCPACHPLHLSLNLYSSSRNPSPSMQSTSQMRSCGHQTMIAPAAAGSTWWCLAWCGRITLRLMAPPQGSCR
jgi:hypothetical protein